MAHIVVREYLSNHHLLFIDSNIRMMLECERNCCCV
jgi:hypothetical protein